MYSILLSMTIFCLSGNIRQPSLENSYFLETQNVRKGHSITYEMI